LSLHHKVSVDPPASLAVPSYNFGTPYRLSCNGEVEVVEGQLANKWAKYRDNSGELEVELCSCDNFSVVHNPVRTAEDDRMTRT
jgi:hypothetical protein